MKKQIFFVTTLSMLLAATSVSGFCFKKEFKKSSGYDTSALPTTIDLNDTSASNIRSYYSSLNSLNVNERKGSSLLKNLKNILKNGQKYYSYDTENSGRKIWQIYEIADRDWEKSPASAISGYNSTTNKISGYSYGTSASSSGTNPYIHALYVDRSVDNNMRAWAQTDTTTSSHGNNKEWGIDREHIWPKSQGFEAEAQGGARGDVMHLWPGDSGVNSALHNDEFYGFVNTNISYTHGYTWSYTKDNYRGTSLTLGTSVSSDLVFEPQDCDKGDIARAIFYLVARYNCLSGSDEDGIDANNPNLELVQSNDVLSAYTSTTTLTGKMGIMTDLLEWHHLDPVDEFEIHRNNLLYTNFTNNRNPFIDFPEWVDFIWGKATYNGRNYQSYNSTPTGYASPSSDTINGYNPSKTLTSITLDTSNVKTNFVVNSAFDYNGLVVTAHYDDSSSAVITDGYTVSTPNMATTGNKTVTVTFGDKSATYTITVSEPVITSISASVSKTYYVGETITKSDITVKDSFDNVITDFTFSNNNYQFVYSDAQSGGNLTNKVFSNSISASGLSCNLTVQVRRKARVTPTTVNDTLNRASTGVTGNSYTSWSGVTATSGVVYAGQSAGGNTSIQLRSANNNSGIISTSSDKYLSGVSVTWNSNTTSGRYITIYGKNTAYSSPTDLYDTSKRGTQLGTIKMGTSTSITVTGSYMFVGVKASEPLYLTNITFNYAGRDSAVNLSNYIMYEDTEGQCNTKYGTAKGYFESLTVEERTTFMNSNDYVILTARARFNAWAIAKGQTIEENNGDYVITQSAMRGMDDINNNFQSILTIALISSSSLMMLVLLFRKKKHR